jgi:DNA-binding CsgD family transcriptional regulator
MKGGFSPSERKCLDLLVKTGSDKAIARELGISSKTVENHIAAAKKKAGIADRVLLAVWWDRLHRSAA